MEKDQQTLIKILSIGDTRVGKSCLIKRYCESRFVQRYITTIGVDYGVKKMVINNKKYSINFFDLSGDDDYNEISREFIKDSQGIIMVFDLENKESFLNLNKWEKILKENGIDTKKSVLLLVGNKLDLKSKNIDLNDINKYAKQKNMDFYQTSANTGENVNKLFEDLFNKVISVIEDGKKLLLKNT